MSLKTAVQDVFGGFYSLLVGMRVTLTQFFKPVITVQYPHATLKLPARFRGHIELILDPETGLPLCTACKLCERACPSQSIIVEGAKREGQKTKSVTDYRLNFTTCSLCGSCVEACNFDALQFSKAYNVVSFDRNQFARMDLVAQAEEKRKQWPGARPAPLPAAAAPAPAPVPPPPASPPPP